MLLRVLSAVLVAGTLLLIGPRAVPSTQATSSPPYLVIMVMDGFRPDYENLAAMHHLHALMQQGHTYDTAWSGHMESETPSGHATIATGAYPRTTGVIGFAWRDRATGQFTYIPTNLGAIQQGLLTQTVEQGGVPTISDLVHARNKKDVTISLSGEKLWASAPMGVGADYVLYGKENPALKKNIFVPHVVGNVPPPSTHYMKVSAPDATFDYQDGFAARLAVALSTVHPRVLFINLPSSDIAGHYYGGMSDPKDMRSIVRGADYAIGQVVAQYKKMGLYNHTVFAVMADHGMVAGKRRVPIHQIYDAVRKTGIPNLDQQLRVSAGSIWLNDPRQAPSLAATLAKGHFAGVEGALYKVQTPTGYAFQATPATARALPKPLVKAYIDLANTEASMPGADILLPYAEDTTGMPVGQKFTGMHGGFSWGSQHIPLIIAGPGVKPGVSHFPAKLVDVAPTLERLIGLPVPPNVDGVVLSDALAAPTAQEIAAQNAVAADRLADVRALQAHSRAQGGAE